jgi:hypothetical protein
VLLGHDDANDAMTITTSITEMQVFTVLRAFILSIVNCEVVRTPVNRVAMPLGDFIALTPLSNIPLSTNVTTYAAASKNVKRASQFTIQIDCYGPGAGDRATAISTLLRDAYAVEQFALSGVDVVPLYAGDAHQLPLVDGEQQYSERWTFEAVLQFNPVMTTPQDSALALTIAVKDVDRTYPP